MDQKAIIPRNPFNQPPHSSPRRVTDQTQPRSHPVSHSNPPLAGKAAPTPTIARPLPAKSSCRLKFGNFEEYVREKSKRVVNPGSLVLSVGRDLN